MTYRDGTRDPALRHTETRLREHLVRAQADRGRRGDHIVTGYDDMDRPVNEPAWRVHERNLMFTLVNQYRAERDLKPVDMREIRRVEDALAGRYDRTDELVRVLARAVHGLTEQNLLAQVSETSRASATPEGTPAKEHPLLGRPVLLLTLMMLATAASVLVGSLAASMAR